MQVFSHTLGGGAAAVTLFCSCENIYICTASKQFAVSGTDSLDRDLLISNVNQPADTRVSCEASNVLDTACKTPNYGRGQCRRIIAFTRLAAYQALCCCTRVSSAVTV
eukprot:2524479-Pleurochrysis_carterae.AAC.6